MRISKQFRNAAPILVMVYAVITAILSIVIYLGIENNIELDHFTQDPATIMNTPFYLGFFSYIGILFWCAAAVTCFFARLVLPDTSLFKTQRQFLLYSGLLTSLLMFDDLFLFHELVFPTYFHIPKTGVYLIYLNIIAVYAILFRNMIIKSEYVILVLAAGLLGLAQFVGYVPMPIPEDSFLKDAVKLFGIVTWFLYFARYSYQAIKKIDFNED